MRLRVSGCAGTSRALALLPRRTRTQGPTEFLGRARGLAALLEVFSPGNEVGARDLPHLSGALDAGEGREVLNVEPVGARGPGVIRVYEPPQLGRQVPTPWNSPRLKCRQRRLNPVPRCQLSCCRFSVETRFVRKVPAIPLRGSDGPTWPVIIAEPRYRRPRNGLAQKGSNRSLR
jgi:hypothetical protein